MVPGTQEVASQIGYLQILYLLSYHAAMLAVYPKFHILHQGYQYEIGVKNITYYISCWFANTPGVAPLQWARIP